MKLLEQCIYHANVNLNLVVENVIQIKNKITKNRDMNVKSIKYVKKIIFRILLHVVVKVASKSSSFIEDSVIMWDEIVDSQAKSYDKKVKSILTNFN